MTKDAQVSAIGRLDALILKRARKGHSLFVGTVLSLSMTMSLAMWSVSLNGRLPVLSAPMRAEKAS